jgi:hypothetical protein
VPRASERSGNSYEDGNSRYELTVAASADDAKSVLEGAYGIWAPEVVGHSAENLRNTGSALRAK